MKNESPERQAMLQNRITTHVCSRCGGKLFIIQWNDALNTPGCDICQRQMWGVTPDVFGMARDAVASCGLCHARIDTQIANKRNYAYLETDALRSNIDKMCEIITWVRGQDDRKDCNGLNKI